MKFEELYTEAALHLDNLAERLLALGGTPVATLHGIIETATVKDALGNESATEMVRTLVADFGIIVNELKEGMSIANREDDESTGDMFLAIHYSLEKHVWMLKSYLG
ncbi:General stress protein 20U [compost metagenome]